ncbi:retrovirus-related pol polyprotein from transposon TNT 1-94 [Tanacetum coccineum]
MNQFCEMKDILRLFSVAKTPQQNGVAERRNKKLIEVSRTMLADSKLPTIFWAEAVNNGRTPNLSFMRPFGCSVTILNTIDHLAKFDGKADEGTQSNGLQKGLDEDPRKESECNDQEKENNVNNNNNANAASTNEVNVVVGKTSIELLFDLNMPALEDYRDDDAEADMNNLDTTIQVSPIPTIRIHKDHPFDQVIGDLQSVTQTRMMSKKFEEHGKNPKRNKKDERGIVIRNKARLVAQGYTQEEGIGYDEVFAPVARMEAIRLFLAYASFKDFVVYQMDVKSAFLYEKIEEEVYVCQPPGFEDPNFPDIVYHVEKALYGLHHAPRAWYETLSTYMLDNGFQRGKIDKTLFIKRHKAEEGWHIHYQDKYSDEILKKFRFIEVKTASTPMETQNLCSRMKMVKKWMFICIDFKSSKVSTSYAVKRIFRDSSQQEKADMWLLQVVVGQSALDSIKYLIMDEAIHKELGDSLVRAATTTSSLEAEQDSGNITKSRSKATPNEAGSQGTTSGGGLRRQEIIGDNIAQTRFKNVFKLSNDPLLARGNTLRSGKDSLKLKELMELCTNLQQIVLDLEKTKTTQAEEIVSLKRRVKKLKQKKRSRTHGLKRLHKVGMSRRVESSGDEDSLGEDASKQGRRINAIDADEDITLVNVQDDAEMFDVNTLTGNEVFVEQEVAAKDVNLTIDEVTLAQALAALKSVKPKVKDVVIQEPSTTTTTTISLQQPSQDKGKGIMVEEPVKTMKKKDLIRLDKEIAKRLQAEFDKEERLAREKDEANVALIEEWDDIQAKIKADHELAQRLQAEEQEELSVKEKAKLFQQLLEQRRKHFAAKCLEEKRNKPPTQAQQRKIMCTYLKNMEGKKPKDLKCNIREFSNLE